MEREELHITHTFFGCFALWPSAPYLTYLLSADVSVPRLAGFSLITPDLLTAYRSLLLLPRHQPWNGNPRPAETFGRLAGEWPK